MPRGYHVSSSIFYSVESLKELGYEVLEARDGPAAMIFLEGEGRIDLIFTDVIPPTE